MERVTLQRIFQRHYPAYRERHVLPRYLIAAADAIMNCRTSAMGRHVWKCAQGHIVDVWYNSCKHRSCPQCAHIQMERWLELQTSKLLACAHFHVIFTIPEALNALWAYNARAMADIFFHAVRDTLFEMLANPKHLGARAGLLAALQTWGRDLSRHPHMHCLVPAGGLGEDGRWIALRNPKFLLPGMAVAALFRGKFLAMMRDALEECALHLPPGMGEQQVSNLLNRLGRDRWHVHVCEPYSHGEGVVKYLARYIKGGPIANGRLTSDDGDAITFSCKDTRDGKTRLICLAPEDFLSRILQHVPPPGLRCFRAYGIYYRGNRHLLDISRAHFGQGPVRDPEFLPFEQFLARKGAAKDFTCPECGGPAVTVEAHYRGRARGIPEPRRQAA